MDLLKSILISVVAAFVIVLAVYALFALFQTVGFLWSLVIVFVLALIVTLVTPDNVLTRNLNLNLNTDRFY